MKTPTLNSMEAQALVFELIHFRDMPEEAARAAIQAAEYAPPSHTATIHRLALARLKSAIAAREVLRAETARQEAQRRESIRAFKKLDPETQTALIAAAQAAHNKNTNRKVRNRAAAHGVTSQDIADLRGLVAHGLSETIKNASKS